MRKTLLRAGRRARRGCAALGIRAAAPRRPLDDTITILKPARVFDGDAMHDGWAVRVKGERIDAVGPERRRAGRREGDRPARNDADARSGRRPLAHPAARLQRNVVERSGVAAKGSRCAWRGRPNHLRETLDAGFTTVRDLGTEGAGYADVELKQAVRRASSPARASSRRRARSSRPAAISRRFVPEWSVPQGAEEADGVDSLTRVVRDQIGRGADWIKLYARLSLGPAARIATRPSRSTK